MSNLTRTLWRICLASYADTAFSGEGSRRYDGRWHSAGNSVVYTASSRSLALLEAAVHADLASGARPRVLIPVTMPVGRLRIPDPSDFPAGWNAQPQGHAARAWGDAWFRAGKTLGTAVPSVLLDGSLSTLDGYRDGEFNVILNPFHAEMNDVEIGEPIPFPLDRRLL